MTGRARPLGWALPLVFLLLSGCFWPSGFREPRDGAPTRHVDVSKIPDAVPKYEPVTRAGNKSPYTVLGGTYRVLPTALGYRARGIGSWYGTKFHGRKTSNGETYSMYAMTAAHKTLPIPSYARVNNLENDRSVIVRVNDRGPFYAGRIIDLSYAAAKKLGYSDKGTARVEVIAIAPGNCQRNSVEAPQIDDTRADSRQTGSGPFLQAGAFTSEAAARGLASRVRLYTEDPVQVRKSDSQPVLFKVLVGPFFDQQRLTQMRQHLSLEKLSPFIVYN